MQKNSIPILQKDKKNIVAKTVSILLCLVTLVPASNLISYIYLIVPVIYVEFIVFKGHYNLSHKEYVEYFRNMSVISVFIFIFSILTLNWRGFLPYEAVFIFCGVFLMRQLRLNTQNDIKGNLTNFSSMIFTLLSGGLGIVIVNTISQNRDKIWSVIRHPLAVLVYIFSMILQCILWIFSKFMALFGSNDIEQPNVKFPEYGDILTNQDNPAYSNSYFDFQKIFVVIILVGICILLFKMLKSSNKSMVHVSADEDYEIITPSPSSKKIRASKLLKNNREKVRLSYIKYLKKLEKEYGKFGKSNTSREIYDKTAEYYDSEKVLELRNLYLKARYNFNEEPDKNDADTSKKLVKEIVKKQDEK